MSVEMENLPLPDGIAGDFIQYRIYDELMPDGSVAQLNGFYQASVEPGCSYVSWLTKKPNGDLEFQLLPHSQDSRTAPEDKIELSYDCSVMEVPAEAVRKRIGWWRANSEGHLCLMRWHDKRWQYHASVEMQLGFVPNNKWHALPIVMGAQNNSIHGSHICIPPDMTVNTVLRPQVFVRNDYENREVVTALRNGVDPCLVMFGVAQLSFGAYSVDGGQKFFRSLISFVGHEGRIHSADLLVVPHRRWDFRLRVRGPLSSKGNIILNGGDFGERVEKPCCPVVTASEGLLRPIETGGGDPNNLVDWLHGDNIEESTFFNVSIMSVAGHWLQLEYDNPVILKYAWWAQHNNVKLGTWKYVGWDGADWIDLTDPFVLGDCNEFEGDWFQAHDLQSNNTAYSVYRLVCVSDDDKENGNPWLREWSPIVVGA